MKIYVVQDYCEIHQMFVDRQKAQQYLDILDDSDCEIKEYETRDERECVSLIVYTTVVRLKPDGKPHEEPMEVVIDHTNSVDHTDTTTYGEPRGRTAHQSYNFVTTTRGFREHARTPKRTKEVLDQAWRLMHRAMEWRKSGLAIDAINASL